MNKNLKIIEDAPGGYYVPGMGTYKPKKMTEGREKTNVKPPYWECVTCGHRAPYYRFEKGMLWWKSIKCDICESDNVILSTKKGPPPPPTSKLRSDDKLHLEFIYNRMVNIHEENANVDYMRRFKEVIER